MGIKEDLGKVFGKKGRITENEDDYLDLDIEEYEEGLKAAEDIKMYIKTAEVTGLYDVPELKKEIYAGNTLILDISAAKQDKGMLEKAVKDLKMAAFDVGGDIAGIGSGQVIVAPAGIKIGRKKLSSK